METVIGMAPAWQVRDLARKKFLEGIRKKFDKLTADGFTPLNKYRVFLHLLSRKLAISRTGISTIDLPEISMNVKWEVFHFFLEISEEIDEFQRSKKEGYALYAKLLEWTSAEIAAPHHAMLQTQEMLEPKLIYGVKDRMKEIPIA